jgi:hypothetical protein
MGTVCKWAVRLFAAVYAAAVGLFCVGTFGLFGQPKDPLAGIFLLPIGLPWNRLISGFELDVRLLLLALAPLVNFAILFAICRFLSRRRGNR